MGSTFLVRHGQASFGAADYDQLSPLGAAQCERLGQWWRSRGQRFDAVYTGRLRRHAQSLAALAQGYGQALPAQVLPALDEYDSEALIRGQLARQQALHPEAPVPGERREHFRILREALLDWMAGELQPEGMLAWADFSGGVAEALAHWHRQHRDATVLVISSGGPISTAVGQLVEAGPRGVIELNMRLRNSAICELVGAREGLRLMSFNHLPHLDDPAHAALQTHV
jgi:broad specificity phosphatase PhoE